MRDDGDFTAYAVARWPAMVRSLVLLGLPPQRAPYVVTGALARLRGDWRHRDELGDLDTHAYGRLLAAWLEARPAAGDPDDPALPLDAEWPSLEGRLDQLTPEQRAAVVLPATADLAEDQVEELLGAHVAGVPHDLGPTVRRVAESVPVPVLDLSQVVARQRADRRARWQRTTWQAAAVLLVVAVVAGGWTWWTTRPAPMPGLSDAAVERRDNPADVGWYVDGTLRLAEVALRIDGLRAFAETGEGAVYADTDGEIVEVTDRGERTRIGRQRPDGDFAVSHDGRRVAWVDAAGSAELRVLDLGSGREQRLEELRSVETARVVAIDGDVVYYDDEGESYAFDLGEGRSTSVRPQLLDAAGGARAYQTVAGRLLVVHQGLPGVTLLGSFGAHIAPDGDHLITAMDEDGDGDREVLLLDTRTGEELDTGLPPGADVLGAKLGGRGLVTYVVEVVQDEPTGGPRLSNPGSLQLVTCVLPSADAVAPGCDVELSFPRSWRWGLAQ